MVTSSLKSNTGDQKVCEEKNLSWLFGVDRKVHPSESLFGITQQSLVMPINLLVCVGVLRPSQQQGHVEPIS